MYSIKAHSQIVNAIDGVGGLGIGEGAPEIVTASRDGKIILYSGVTGHFIKKSAHLCLVLT